MAVYEHKYKRYAGVVTPQWSRFLVVTRYVFKDVFQSKILVFFFALCFLWPVICAVMIWVRNSAAFLDAFGGEAVQPLNIDVRLFILFMKVQGALAFFFTMLVGPGLISRDLANNGLPLYLSRPLSRVEYVSGKVAVLAVLLSLITWVPGLGLYALQSGLDPGDWMSRHARMAVGMFVGFWVWILVLSLVALALSAWLKWRPVAGVMMLMIFLMGSFFASVVNGLFRTGWGHVVDPGRLGWIVWAWLIGAEMPPGPPVAVAWLGLAALAALALFLLHVKLRAYEVVR